MDHRLTSINSSSGIGAAVPCRTAARNARNAAADVAGRMVTATSQVRAEVWAVLTPEQRIKAKAMQAERRQRMSERRKDRGKDRGGRDREM